MIKGQTDHLLSLFMTFFTLLYCSSKESTHNAGDTGNVGSILGLGRSSGEGNGYSLQFFLPGEFHGQRNLASYSPWSCKELDRTEHACTPFPFFHISTGRFSWEWLGHLFCSWSQGWIFLMLFILNNSPPRECKDRSCPWSPGNNHIVIHFVLPLNRAQWINE